VWPPRDESLSIADYEWVVGGNLSSVIYAVKAFLPLLNPAEVTSLTLHRPPALSRVRRTTLPSSAWFCFRKHWRARGPFEDARLRPRLQELAAPMSDDTLCSGFGG
jgi:hypothetical protein